MVLSELGVSNRSSSLARHTGVRRYWENVGETFGWVAFKNINPFDVLDQSTYGEIACGILGGAYGLQGPLYVPRRGFGGP